MELDTKRILDIAKDLKSSHPEKPIYHFEHHCDLAFDIWLDEICDELEEKYKEQRFKIRKMLDDPLSVNDKALLDILRSMGI